jgi:Tol biopolymer transport system component
MRTCRDRPLRTAAVRPSGASKIWVMKANGKEQHQITQTAGFVNFPDLPPDGTKLVFGGRVPRYEGPVGADHTKLTGPGTAALPPLPGPR